MKDSLPNECLLCTKTWARVSRSVRHGPCPQEVSTKWWEISHTWLSLKVQGNKYYQEEHAKYPEAQEEHHWGEWAFLEDQKECLLAGKRETWPPSKGGNTGKTLSWKSTPIHAFFFPYNKYLLSTHYIPGTVHIGYKQVVQYGWSSRYLRQDLDLKPTQWALSRRRSRWVWPPTHFVTDLTSVKRKR